MIKIAIFGYGNIARGVEAAVNSSTDMELVAVFTRRNPDTVQIASAGVPVLGLSDLDNWTDKVDVMVICGGSATDLPELTPMLAAKFNVVDSFDTHATIPQHFANVQTAAAQSGHLAMTSSGWDPGLFSLARVYAQAVLPQGESYTFWGRGVSQGHSDAVRRIAGVVDCRQYTVPIEAAMQRVRNGEQPHLSTGEKHTRECYVVAEEGADLERITREIKTMPNYFDEYETSVHFITAQEMAAQHSAMPHGGFVIRSGNTQHAQHVIEYSLKLESNPEFTGSVLAAYARAIHRLHAKGQIGCVTVLDVPPAAISPLDADELRAHYL